MDNLNPGSQLVQEFCEYNFEARDVSDCLSKLHGLVQEIKIANSAEDLFKLENQTSLGINDIDHSVRIIKSWFQSLNPSDFLDQREANAARPKIKKLMFLFELLRSRIFCVKREISSENGELGVEILLNKEKAVIEMEMKLIEVHRLLVDLNIGDKKWRIAVRARKRSKWWKNKRLWFWIAVLVMIVMLLVIGLIVVLSHGSSWGIVGKCKNFLWLRDN